VLLKEHADRLDEEGRDYLQRIRAAAQRMASLIDDLLRLSRFGRAALDRQAVDLSAMAREIAGALREADGDRVVAFEIEPGMVDVGDERLLRVALENLLGNAWKFSAKRPRARIGFGRAVVDGVRAYAVHDKRHADQLARDHVNLPVEEGLTDPGHGLPRRKCGNHLMVQNWSVGATRCKGGADFRRESARTGIYSIR